MAVRRDQWGIPHVTAASLLETAREQGRACVEDRAGSLRTLRLRGEGRTAELRGAAGLEWDVFARRALLDETGRRAFDAAGAQTQAFVTAYVDGVNDALPGHEPWHPWTPATVFLVQHVLFGTFPTKLWRDGVVGALGDDGAALLRAEGPPHGSNAYAVTGARTATGLPIVAGDPHRLFEDPNVYAQVRLTCTDPDDPVDVTGFSFPGVPGIQHFGHAGGVAWAITNAMADYQDVYRESAATMVGARRHTETIDVRDGDPVEVDVVVTDRGPVVLDHPDGGGWSLRTPSLVLGELGLDAWLPLLRARTVGDVERAFTHWVEPVNNVVAADTTGAVSHHVAGRVPLRDDALRLLPGQADDGHGWTGWVDDLPRIPVPADGHVVTANDRATAAYDVVGVDFAPPHRARRIAALLDAQPALDVEAAGAVLTDVLQTAGESLLAHIATLGGEAADRLAAWDRRMTAGSVDAALFVRVREHLVAAICDAPALRELREPSPYGDLLAPWFALPARVATGLETLLAHDRPFGVDLDGVLREALDAAVDGDGTWGERHRFAASTVDGPGTAPDLPLSGDTNCVMATGWLPGLDLSVRGSVARYVWCLADRDASRWVVPLGATGDPGSDHHHDQQGTWARGGMLPVVEGAAWLLLERSRNPRCANVPAKGGSTLDTEFVSAVN